MPFNSLPGKDFLNRESELACLKRLADSKRDALAGNVLLEGARGAGKTELLKQLYRNIFWDEGTAPFYYSFKTAALKGTYFAKDYFSRFIRQYVAFLKKEPSLIDNMGIPLGRLLPVISELGLDWLIDLMEAFQEYADSGDLYGQVLAAISVPVAAAQKGDRPLLIMLDDFTMADQLYETNRGDAPGLISLFEESMKNNLCPHIITGSPEGVLEAIFTDSALRKRTERVFLNPLSADVAYSLFESLLDTMAVSYDEDASRRFLRLLGGNPLYIRMMARAARKMQKKELSERDLLECYSYEVTDGDISFYWSSVLRAAAPDRRQRGILAQLIVHSVNRHEDQESDRLSKILGIREADLGKALDLLQTTGIASQRDAVFQDVMQSIYLKEYKAEKPEKIRELVEAKYASESAASSFEMVIPMSSNAELVAAKAMDQIGKNMNLDPDLLNYIQLALIESCINAMEHSGSYEKKVFLKFITEPNRLEIIIESPGKPFSLDSVRDIPTEEKLRGGRKRGWGFDLMRKIMDDVRVERIGEKTRVVLIKNIKKNEVLQ
ncbi:MAG: ATP-binding protein [Nitrospirae bacterium]|nr:ATP-binding protein [Nitrospirota bacterium]